MNDAQSLPARIAPYTHHDGRDLGVLDERGGKAAREPGKGADTVLFGPRSSSTSVFHREVMRSLAERDAAERRAA